MAATEDSSKSNLADDKLLEETLYRLTQGLSQRELKQIIAEAEECEQLLEKEIAVLEANDNNNNDEVEAILDSMLTPLDTFWTISAHLGRLRGELEVPRLPHSPPLQESAMFPPPKVPTPDDLTAINSLNDIPLYSLKQDNPTNLLALYKKVSSHRASVVFKRPVKPEEAPGYTDRISFPMDLSLIRKMIVAKQIVSYQDFHECISLIAHNCVKFNGRESDYGMVGREFEHAADEAIRQTIMGGSRKSPALTPPAGVVTAASSGAGDKPSAPEGVPPPAKSSGGNGEKATDT